MINRFAVFTTMLCAAVLSSTPNLQAQGFPPGSYLLTCSNVQTYGDRLMADCRRKDGSSGRTALRDVDRCVGDIGNLDGQLVCNRAEQSEVKNIVLVHGAWADGSGWRGVYDILVGDGFNVTVVQEPETAFLDDVTAVKRILALQDGPSILVAHSYGGSVVTEAGTDPSVVGLVYVAAHMPDAGESESGDGRLFPSDLSKSNAMQTTPDGFTFLDPARFPFFFAPDLPVELADFMAHSQVFNAAVNFQFVITRPAWREKPSWMVVAGADRIINPDLERFYAARAGSRTSEVAGASHSVFISHPEEVADVIERAARARSVISTARKLGWK
jgi:pimeloyl-ACP methyl ester carboxylesterase